MAFEIIASLNVGESAKEISEKIKSELNPKVNADKPLRLIGNLDVANTKKQIEQELQKITGLKIPEISAKINTTNITQSLDNVRNQTSKITNEMVAEFNKMASIPSKVQGTDKSSFNSQIKNLLGDFKNGDIETSKNALLQLTKIIDEQSKVVMQDKSNIDYLKEELRQLGKVHIDKTIQKDLRTILGSAEKVTSVLTTLFGTGGYSYKSGVGDISGLFGNSATLSRFTADADGLIKIYQQLQNMKQSTKPQSIFDVGGLSKAEADMRVFLNTIVGVPNYILETERATDSLNKKLNEQSMVLRLTQSEFEVLRNTKFNNIYAGVYDNLDGSHSLVDDLNRIRAVIVETENTAKQTSNTNKVIQTLSNSFSNLQGNFIKPLKPTIDVSGVIDADKTFKDFQNRFKEFTGVNVSGAFKSVDLNGNIVKQLDKVFVSFKNSNNEAQKFVYTLNETDKMFNFTSASYNDSGVDKQIAKANVEATKLQTTLDGLKAKLSDINSSKPIKSADNIAKLESEYIKVQQAIGNVKKADSQTMTQMIANANSAISAYKSLGNSLKNSEYVASQLRAKDIGTVHQIEIENLKNFEAQIKNSVVPTKELQKDLKKLKNILAQPVSNQSMIDYFNSFDVAKAKFSALKEQYKSNDEVKYYDRLKNAIKEANKLEAKRLSASGSSTEYSKELDKQLKNAKERVRYNQKQIEQKKLYNQVLNEEVKYLERSLQRELSLKQAEQATKQQQKAEAERIKQQQQATKQQQKDIDSLNKSIDSNISKMNQMSNRAIFRTNANDTSVKNMQDTFKRLEADYTKLKSKLNENLTPEALKNLQNQFNALAPEFDRVIQKSKQLDASFRNSNSITAFNSKINTLRNQIEAFMKNNPKALKSGYDKVFNDMLNGLNNCANSQAFNKIKSEFIKTRQQINRLGLTGNTVFGTLKEKVSKFASWMGITMATATVAREIRGMFSTIVELDTALVDLNKTFTGTQTELNDFYYSANKIAKSLGVTTTEVINQASAWSRLGYSTAETANQMATLSSQFALISPGMSTDLATDGLISMMKAFGVEVADVKREILDNVNEIGNTFAVNNEDIVEAMTRSSSAMAMANNSIEETIALNTASVEITRNADTTANAWRTVSMRLRGKFIVALL